MPLLPRLRRENSKLEFLEKCDWQAALAFRAYGVRVGIRVNNPDLLEQIENLLPPTSVKLKPDSKVDHLFSIIVRNDLIEELFRNDEKRVDQGNLDEALQILESLLRLTVAEFSPRRVFVHAGVVAWRGKALIIPGFSYSGKTTFTAAMIRAGAVYYSDEYAVLDQSGRVHPFPKPLSIREDWANGRQIDYEVKALGGRQGLKPLPVGAVLITAFDPSAQWQPQPLSAGQGVLALLEHTVSAQANPGLAMRVLSKAVDNSTILKSLRGDADKTAEFILDSLKKSFEKV